MTIPSIRGAVTRRLMAGTITLAVAVNIALWFYLREEVTEQYDAALYAKARALAAMVQPDEAGGQPQFHVISRAMPEFRVWPNRNEYFEFRDTTGRALARSPSLAEDLLPPSPVADLRRDHVVFEAPLPDGRRGNFIELRFDLSFAAASGRKPKKGRSAFNTVLVLATDRAEMRDTLVDIGTTLAVTTMLLSMGALATVILSLKGGLRPLEKLADEATRIDAEKLEFRFGVDDMPRELQPIAARLNDLLARLEASFRRERRFTDDAAHELRTPIAEIRTLMDVAIKWPPTDVKVHAANYRQVSAASKQMESVVQALLTLSRHQSGVEQASQEKIALSTVLQNVWLTHQPLAAAKGLQVTFNIPPELHVFNNRAMLVSLLNNVLSNATHHTRPGTGVTCRADNQGSGNVMRLVVTNDSAGLTPLDVSHIGEPFWQKNPARTGSAHAGLGCALVKQYAATLGIKCVFSLPQPDRFSVELIWEATLPSVRAEQSAERRKGDLVDEPPS